MEKIILALSDKVLADRYTLSINQSSKFRVIKSFLDGKELVSYIAHDQVDILIIDLCLSQLDGISAINMIKNNYNYNVKKIIVISDFSNQNIVNLLSNLKIDYFLLKPVMVEGLITILDILSNSEIKLKDADQKEELEAKVNRIVTNLGFPSHISGSHYLVTAICSATRSSYLSGQLTKRLYPEVAKEHNTTASRVERSIRHAIEVTYNRNPKAMLSYLQGYNYKPTNAELIATISDKLRIEL